MNTMQKLSAKRYEWQGQIWSTFENDTRPTDEQEAVTLQGEVAPLADLLLALYKGDATEVYKGTTGKEVTLKLVPPPLKAGDMDEVGKARAMEKIAKAEAMGVTLPKSKGDGLFYDLGTAVMPEAWSAERQAFEKLPTGAVAIPKVTATIRAEDRENFEFPAWDLRMSKTSGKLGNPETKQAWEPTKRALQGFFQRSGIGTVPDHWPTDIKAATVNALCDRFGKEHPAELRTNDEDPRVVLRVQKASGKAFAAVSPSYGQFDGDLVLEALERAIPQGSRVGIHYDSDAARGRVELITLQEEQPVVGEPFKTSFTVGWDDTGGGSVWGDGGLWSARCLNLTRIWTSVGTFRMRHAGHVTKLVRRFRHEFERIAAVVTQFSVAYGMAASEELTNKEKLESHEFLQGIYRSLLQRDLVPVKGRKDDVVKALTMQFLADENKAGITRAGIANGITRYAHTVNQDPWARDDLERAAGRIVWSPRPIKLDYLAKEVA